MSCLSDMNADALQGRAGLPGIQGQKGSEGDQGRDGKPGLDGFPGPQVKPHFHLLVLLLIVT